MASEMWELSRAALLVLAVVLMLRVLYRLKVIEGHMATESDRRSAMVDTVTQAAMKVATQTSEIAKRLALDTERAANHAAEESALRHKVLGADLSKVLEATHKLAEELAKKVEKPVLAETIQDATHKLAEDLGGRIDTGNKAATGAFEAANHASEKIAETNIAVKELTAVVAAVAQKQGVTHATVPPLATQLDEIQATTEETLTIVKEPGR